MTRIPALTSREFVAALKRAGYTETGQKGSHLILKHSKRPTVIVPIHAQDPHRGLMLRLIKQAEFAAHEFIELL